MKVIVIGGSGHIGTYLIPRLVEMGHYVVNVTRGQSHPYLPHPAWKTVERVVTDRLAAETAGTFGALIATLEPDAVIDLISFTPQSTRHLVESLRGRVRHFLHCGTIWVKGVLVEAPTTEETPSPPFGEYGINKAAIAEYLLTQARRGDFPATLIHPGHIVGPGHFPVNPAANHNPEVFRRLIKGEPLYLPNFGMDLVHHVHADDVAQLFCLALNNWNASVAEQFFAVSPAALTLRGFAQAVARWFQQPADLRFVAWEEWKSLCNLSAEDIEDTYAHISHGQCCSTAKAARLLGYQPRYTSLQAVFEALDWMIENDVIIL